MKLHLSFFIVTSTTFAAGAAESNPTFTADMQRARIVIKHSDQPVADYVFRDDKVLRPFFANVRAPGGVQVTRNFPPIVGVDATDHADMHPGIALGFGSVSGEDFWRNKAAIRHERFNEPPAVRGGRLTFATESTMLAANGNALATLMSRFTLAARPGGWLLEWDAAFTPLTNGFHFGDQEEMGFAVRMATPLTEKSGGVILNSHGQRGAKTTWGQPAAWCDYSGVIGGVPTGVTVIPSPGNFRPSWWHNRDYGVFVANPFGQKAMKQGDTSRMDVKRGETFRLRFAVFIHAGTVDVAAEAGRILREMKN
jgi:hypothetical protein